MKCKWIAILFFILISFSLISSSRAEDDWWDNTWSYRIKLEVNSTRYDRIDWPIEMEANFTEYFKQSLDGVFDDNSTRIVEYNSTGSVLYEVKSQFDKGEFYNETTNAVGTVVWIANGTTAANTKRYYYIYFDRIRDQNKTFSNYSSEMNLTYSGEGSEEFQLNTSTIKFHIDTVRGENTSGIYRVDGTELDGSLFNLGSSLRTAEYQEYSNGTHNLTFDIESKTNFTVGAVRVIVEQTGDEVIWFTKNQTGVARLTKRYYFYEGLPWVKVYQNITNIGPTTITRNSTIAGSLAFDAERAWENHLSGGNTTEPFSWTWAADEYGAFMGGVINLNHTGTANFSSFKDQSAGRIGIQLNNTQIPPNQSITQTALMIFNDTSSNYVENVENVKNRFETPVNLTIYRAQVLPVYITPKTDYNIYNRNESLIITGNITYDPFNYTAYVNATLDMGTSNTSDDVTLILHDDQTNGDLVPNDMVFTNFYNLSNSAEIGVWTLTSTVYNLNLEILNQTTTTFNVTGTYNLTLYVQEQTGFVNRTINLTVDVANYRNDIYIPSALVNCSYNSTYLSTPTDYGNGTYFIQITAPDAYGNWLVNCTADKNQNHGERTSQFSTEGLIAYMSINTTPQDYTSTLITINTSETFNLTVNSTVFGDANAYDVNITVGVVQNISVDQALQNCGNLGLDESCIKNFSITVENTTPPGLYQVNFSVIWKDPQGTIGMNETLLNISVTSNYIMDVFETGITGPAARGQNTTIHNFTILSIGNDNITNFDFDVSGLPGNFVFYFVPSVSRIHPGSNVSLETILFVPFSAGTGLYNGTLNVSSTGGSEILTINITASGTNFTVDLSTTNYTASTIMWNVTENFTFQVNSTNMGNVTGYGLNMTLELPSNFNSNSSFVQCGDLNKTNVCITDFEIAVGNGTTSGNYLINVSGSWFNPAIGIHSNTSTLNVSVTSNVQIEIFENNISSNSTEGEVSTIGNFTIRSIGNDPVFNISLNVSGLSSNISLEFTPNVTQLNGGVFQPVIINSTVDHGFDPGIYNSTLNVSSSGGSKNISLIIEVPSTRTWVVNSTNCTHKMAPETGTLCSFMVNNTGNVNIYFSVNPENGNYTTVNGTNFTIPKQDSHTFLITYNASGAPVTFHYSYFNLTSPNETISPSYQILMVSLNPFIGPLINFTMSPNETKQLGSIYVLADVLDQSTTGLNWVKINITTPSNITFSNNMTNITEITNVSQWEINFPGNWGNTSEKGYYTFLIYAMDNVNTVKNDTDTLLIYTNLSIFIDTLSSSYQQGETGTVYVRSFDSNDENIQGAESFVTVVDSQGNVTYNSSHTTSGNGVIYPMPKFEIYSDSPTGNYTVYSNTTFTDAFSKTVNSSSAVTFEVLPTTGGGLFADVETVVVWYPESVMKFGILVEDGGGDPVDPDSMNLTVYDAADNQYFSVSLGSMTREREGYYTYQFAMPVNTSTGMFLADLNVFRGELETQALKAFRVSSGGPYDVYLNLLEHEVPRGDYLDFEIIVINMGDVSQDVDIEYWISEGNRTWYYASEAIFVAGLTNKTLPRNAFVFSNQTLGVYTLNVKVKYSNIQPEIEKNETFSVVEPSPPTTVPPGGGGGGGAAPVTVTPDIPVRPEKVSKIEIRSYPQEISIESGWVKYPTVEVKNTGETNLHNVQLMVRGIPEEWISVQPESFNALLPDETQTFNLRLDIPEGTESTVYNVQLTATSDETENNKIFKLLVFASRAELIEYEIKKVEEDLEDLKNKTEIAKNQKKDVTRVLELIVDIEREISNSRKFLEESNYEDALASVITASNLIERAEYVLETSVYIEPGFFEIVPVWLILIILLLILIILVLLIKLKKIKINMLKLLKPVAPEAIKAIEMMKEPLKKEQLEVEKKKLERTIKLLESQRSEGLISKKAFTELKSRNEDKLKLINKRIKRLSKL